MNTSKVNPDDLTQYENSERVAKAKQILNSGRESILTNSNQAMQTTVRNFLIMTITGSNVHQIGCIIINLTVDELLAAEKFLVGVHVIFVKLHKNVRKI